MLNDVHVSLDIEACGEIVLSIGACTFDPRTGEELSPCYVVPSIVDQIRAGLRPDGDALLWLLKQSDGCREAIHMAQTPAQEAFGAFIGWWPDRAAWTWAYPTSFDLPVIQRALAAFGNRPPWKWTRTMDGRTLWQLAIAREPNMAKIEQEAATIEHHALEDARQQARWYAKYLSAVTP